ncbi:MAG: hypothetical protein COB16_05950 [Rhodobacteraceae bacterium]|nr:MAG: hypothetical protein COB16_05950 [Paracoccaceae bacterium]
MFLAFLLGIFVGVAAVFQILPSLAQRIIEVIADSIFGLASVMGEHNIFVENNLTKAATTSLSVFAVSVAPIRAIVSQIWAEPPTILDQEITRVNSYPDDPLAETAALVGRDEEMRNLMIFAGQKAGSGATWMALTGAHAVGKSRLANAWLRRLRELGWSFQGSGY